MKILWAKADFLHPTTRGGQIRTLEMLRVLSRGHEIHYVALDDGKYPEGYARSGEYCARAYPIAHHVPGKRSIGFAGQLAAGLFSPLPVAVSRYRSAAMKKVLGELLEKERFDTLVCDFLSPAPNIPDLSRCVLFQHNVETMIWRRHAEHAPDPVRRGYLAIQARRMAAFERSVCREAGYVAGVSAIDVEIMKKEFGVQRIGEIPTGVDLDYFAPPPNPAAPGADLIFVGSMDWMANIDAVTHFVENILPRVHTRKPDCSVAIVGRNPSSAILGLAARDRRITVTGTVADIRPYLWGATLSIVPLRVGGGTRLKIYESIAAKVPVVSTTIGAEGLPLKAGKHISIADHPDEFAAACLALLDNTERRRERVACAYSLVSEKFSWKAAVGSFEDILRSAPRAH